MAAGRGIPHSGLIAFLIGGMIVFTVAEMMQSPTSTALAAAASVGELRGRYMAVYQYGYQIAKIIAPILFTQLFVVNVGLPWIVLAVAVACAIPALLVVEKRLPADALRPAAGTDQADPAPVAADDGTSAEEVSQ
jgi:formate hydrogenlyase subunit 4